MVLKGIDLNESISKAKAAMDADEGMSDSTRSVMELLIVIIGIVVEMKMSRGSKTSSPPPSQDINRIRGTNAITPYAVSEGTIGNTLERAYRNLGDFEHAVKQYFTTGVDFQHNDETGSQIGTKRNWIHSYSNEHASFFCPHENRGRKAMDEIGVLPKYTGISMHDEYSSYFTFKNCTHVLCNAHHLRELEAIIVTDNLKWAQAMKQCLIEARDEVNASENQKLYQHAQKEQY